MAKKNKKLKKKKSSAIITSQLEQEISTPVNAAMHPSTGQAVKTQPQKVSTHQEADSSEFKHVRGDVKKILILLGFIVLILIGLYFLDIKTSYLSSAATWIYNILNIQTQ